MNTSCGPRALRRAGARIAVGPDEPVSSPARCPRTAGRPRFEADRDKKAGISAAIRHSGIATVMPDRNRTRPCRQGTVRPPPRTRPRRPVGLRGNWRVCVSRSRAASTCTGERAPENGLWDRRHAGEAGILGALSAAGSSAPLAALTSLDTATVCAMVAAGFSASRPITYDCPLLVAR